MPNAVVSGAQTLVEVLQRQAECYGDKIAFRFSYNGDGENTSSLSYRALDVRSRAIAAKLQQQGAEGQRVLVFCRPGLEGIVGYFGCLYAGAIPVPVHERLAPRLSSVVPNAQARFALAAPQMPTTIKAAVDTLIGWIDGQPLGWCGTDVAVADAQAWVPPDVDAASVALLQFTSGSTHAPKGVMVTHGNLLDNLAAIHRAWPGDDQEVAVYWLPPHHDMGLIGAVLEMVYLGCTTELMSPTAFIKRPMAWLEAISRCGGTFTTAPNFAYQLCVQRSTPEERAGLDLSRLSTVMNGAEPVQAATMQAFAEVFAPVGFRREAFMPVYGLAEATLLVSGGSAAPVPVVCHLDRGGLQEDRVVDADPQDPGAVALVSCGVPRQEISIVDPETRRRCEPDRVGEIWIAGPSVGQGYWGLPEETEEIFCAFVAETGEGPFLRTGDLGFVREGELFVAGRCKDLVVIDGHHYYPHDIELTVQGCRPDFRSGRGAVFSVAAEGGGVEQLVMVQEIDGGISEGEFRESVEAIQSLLTTHHGIRADSVILVAPMSIPTTSSGKIQRGACRDRFLERALPSVAEWHAPLRTPPARMPAESIRSQLTRSPRLGRER